LRRLRYLIIIFSIYNIIIKVYSRCSSNISSVRCDTLVPSSNFFKLKHVFFISILNLCLRNPCIWPSYFLVLFDRGRTLIPDHPDMLLVEPSFSVIIGDSRSLSLLGARFGPDNFLDIADDHFSLLLFLELFEHLELFVLV